MKVLKKVLTAIGHFFRNIWRYIMTNAWIQPILIVALIFAIIFGLTGIPNLVDKVKGLFNDTADNKIKNRKVIDYDDFMKMYNNNETFFVVFGSDDNCASCKKLYNSINTYMKDEEHKNIVNAKIYFFDVDELMDDVQKDLDKYGDTDFATKGKNFDKLDEISNILYDGYADILSSFNNNEQYVSEQTTYGKYDSTWGIKTPTTAFFTKDANGEHSKMFNMVVGTWEYNNSYSGINTLFECWHASVENWDAACDTRDELVDRYTGTI